MKRVGRLGEARLISLIGGWLGDQERHRALLRGIGDDCAVVRGGPRLLFTNDAFVEDVHFRRKWATAWQAGWKSLAANVSDIGAGGGVPLAALVSLELPASLEVKWLKEFYAGLRGCGRRYRVVVAGGNVCAGRRIAVHISLIGGAPPRVPGRRGAKPGDLVAVTGTLGGSLAGLLCLERRIRAPAARAAVLRHLLPQPSIETGRLLARFSSAQVDISDGLGREARLLADASKVRLVLVPGAVPVHPAAVALAGALGRAADDLALDSGEEYELLATFPRGRFRRAAEAARRRGARLTAIGEVRHGRGVALLGERRSVPEAYEHFR